MTRFYQDQCDVFITAHRGMGVLSKLRHEFIDTEMYYPENAPVSFEKAMLDGAEALECDIHVSSDFVPMLIHGNKITDYANYIDTNSTDFFKRDGDKLISRYTCEEIQSKFHLRVLSGLELEI